MSELKLSCYSHFQRAFTVCSCVLKVITLAGTRVDTVNGLGLYWGIGVALIRRTLYLVDGLEIRSDFVSDFVADCVLTICFDASHSVNELFKSDQIVSWKKMSSIEAENGQQFFSFEICSRSYKTSFFVFRFLLFSLSVLLHTEKNHW